MRRVCGSNRATRLVVSGLCVAFLSAVCGPPAPAAGSAFRGAETSDAAAGATLAGTDGVPSKLAGWQPTPSFIASALAADTTEVEFPVDEEQKRQHLYRDIGIFLLVSAFVGYFLVKVFLEGDTDEPPPPKKGKGIPTS